MPLPTPRKGEKKDEFVSRCMGDEEARRTFPDQQQRAGVCYSQWTGKHGKENLTAGEIMANWTGVSDRCEAMLRGGIPGLLALHMRLSQVTARTARYRFRNAGPTGAEIYLRGPIGMDFFGDGITGQSFTRELKSLGDVKTIDLYIDSPGGSVTDGRVIYNQLVTHPAKVNVIVDGFACSAASFVAMAGDTIRIGEGSFFMIHNAQGMAAGDHNAAYRLGDLLKSVTDTIATTYVARTGIPKQTVLDWMDAETWFDGQAAVDNKFATEMIPSKTPPKAVAYGAAFANMPVVAARSRAQAAREFLERSKRGRR